MLAEYVLATDHGGLIGGIRRVIVRDKETSGRMSQLYFERADRSSVARAFASKWRRGRHAFEGPAFVGFPSFRRRYGEMRSANDCSHCRGGRNSRIVTSGSFFQQGPLARGRCAGSRAVAGAVVGGLIFVAATE